MKLKKLAVQRANFSNEIKSQSNLLNSNITSTNGA